MEIHKADAVVPRNPSLRVDCALWLGIANLDLCRVKNFEIWNQQKPLVIFSPFSGTQWINH